MQSNQDWSQTRSLLVLSIVGSCAVEAANVAGLLASGDTQALRLKPELFGAAWMTVHGSAAAVLALAAVWYAAVAAGYCSRRQMLPKYASLRCRPAATAAAWVAFLAAANALFSAGQVSVLRDAFGAHDIPLR